MREQRGEERERRTTCNTDRDTLYFSVHRSPDARRRSVQKSSLRERHPKFIPLPVFSSPVTPLHQSSRQRLSTPPRESTKHLSLFRARRLRRRPSPAVELVPRRALRRASSRRCLRLHPGLTRERVQEIARERGEIGVETLGGGRQREGSSQEVDAEIIDDVVDEIGVILVVVVVSEGYAHGDTTREFTRGVFGSSRRDARHRARVTASRISMEFHGIRWNSMAGLAPITFAVPF